MNYNFEIHLTVEWNQSLHFDSFKKVCEEMNAKAIAINLEKTEQIMTSKTINTDVEGLFNSLLDDVKFLTDNGYNVVRRKIESCPKFIKETKYDAKYYEIHVPCYSEKINSFDFTKLKSKWHKSKNKFKDDIHMITCRVNCSTVYDSEEEKIIIDKDIELLKSLDIVHPSFKHHYEYAIYDTNIKLDKGWIS